MAQKRYDIGTPVGGERKQGRFQSPLNSMDGDDELEEKVEEVEEGEEDVKSMFRSMMRMMKSVKSDLGRIETTAGQAKMTAEMASAAAEAAGEKVKELGTTVEELKETTVKKDDIRAVVEEVVNEKVGKTANLKVTTNRKVAVIGGFGKAESMQEAKDYIVDKLSKAGVKAPDEMYHKGDEFKGILFARFGDGEAMDTAISTIRSQRLTFKGNLVWCGPDRPLQERVPLGFLLGLKRMLVGKGWEFSKKAVKVEEEDMVIKVGGTRVLQAKVEDQGLAVTWLADDWKNWDDFAKSKEFADLRSKADERLTNVGEGGTKGLGKGKVPM